MFYTSINIPDVDSYILSFSLNNAENARVGVDNSWTGKFLDVWRDILDKKCLTQCS